MMATIRSGGLRRLLSWPSRESADPLGSPAGAEAWVAGLTSSVTQGAQQIVQMLSDPRPEGGQRSLAELEALFVIDQAAAQRTETLAWRFAVGAKRADRGALNAWTSAFELSQALAGAYRGWLDELPEHASDRAWTSTFSLAGARYLHYRSVERRLRAMRFEQWIPGKWRELYCAYDTVRRLCGEKQWQSKGSGRRWPPAEYALVGTLLVDTLHRGAFSVRELDWALRYLRRWLPQLRLEEAAASGACWIDIKSTGGLRRPVAEGSPPPGALFLEIRPIVERLRDRAEEHAARENGRYRIATTAARRLVEVLQAQLGEQRTRAPRGPSQATARVVVGFEATILNLAFARERGRKRELDMGYELRRPLARFVELDWPPPGSVAAGGLAVIGRFRDVSETGLRVALPSQEWGMRSVGELVAIQEADTTSWRLGVVRRVTRPRSDTVEAGVELFTTAPSCVRLTDIAPPAAVGDKARPAAPPLYGIFVPPGKLSRPALILPTSAVAPGRRFSMPTTHAIYILGLSRLAEQGPDWALCEVGVHGKAPVDGPGGDRPTGTEPEF